VSRVMSLKINMQ